MVSPCEGMMVSKSQPETSLADLAKALIKADERERSGQLSVYDR
jgi:hypothetical protein